MQPTLVQWLKDPVYQIREQAIVILIQLSKELMDQRWLEEEIFSEALISEFSRNAKFQLRIHCLFMIQNLYKEVTNSYMNEILMPQLLHLEKDPVPNIRFTISRTIELIHKQSSISNSNKLKLK